MKSKLVRYRDENAIANKQSAPFCIFFVPSAFGFACHPSALAHPRSFSNAASYLQHVIRAEKHTTCVAATHCPMATKARAQSAHTLAHSNWHFVLKSKAMTNLSSETSLSRMRRSRDVEFEPSKSLHRTSTSLPLLCKDSMSCTRMMRLSTSDTPSPHSQRHIRHV
jgi:hypothetical protein